MSNCWSALALRTAGNIAKSWGLNDRQFAALLGSGATPERLAQWRQEAAGGQVELPDEVAETLGLLIEAHRTLVGLLGSEEAVKAWLVAGRVGPTSQRQAPLSLLTDKGTEGLWRLCIHVDAWSTGRAGRVEDRETTPAAYPL